MAGPRLDPCAPNAIVAGMLGVLALAVQTTLVQISLRGAPSTAVMTTNLLALVLPTGLALLAVALAFVLA